MTKMFRFLISFIKLFFAWIVLHTLKRNLLNDDIWLIREKRDEARDNGYHFYKYLKESKKPVNSFYVITPNAADRKKIEKYGTLIDADSFRHCIYFLAARFSINSQPYGAYPFSFSTRQLLFIRKIFRLKQKVIFLQHGIIQNKLDVAAFSYSNCNIDYFVTSTKKEYQFVKETFSYPDETIGCVGLARFDNLYSSHNVENNILVMPTWRKWLDNSNFDDFQKSDYYIRYSELLNDDELISFLKGQHYKLVFYMHYKLQPFVNLFKKFENDVVIIADKAQYDVQDLLMTSKFMITDYSSVYFDFAYMNKPLLYYQFDQLRFRDSHYAEGYFSYEKDGFGPCFDKSEDVKEYIFTMVKDECRQPERYNSRVIEFFDLRDNNNCERIYNAIKGLDKQSK